MIVGRNYEYSNKAGPMLLMIDNYDSFTYNVVQYLGELGADVKVFRNDEVTLKDIEAMKPSQTRHSVNTGPQVEMVGVGQHYLCPQRLYLFWKETFHRGLSGDSHESRGGYVAV